MAGASGARRIVINRGFIDAAILAVADGAFETAKAIVEAARVPDAAPYGEGLVQGGGVIAFVGSKRVGVWSKTGAAVKKPRAAKLSKGVTVLAGFGFPGRFVESGTTRMGAQPFLTPAVMAGIPGTEAFVRAACVRHGIIGKARAAKGDVFGGGKK